MDVTPLIKQGQQIIQSYSNGVFKVNGKRFDHALIIRPDGVMPWDVSEECDIDYLSADHFSYFIDHRDSFDVFLFGCGSTQKFMPKALKTELRQRGVSFDIMDTGAACRTYNVLMAEGRRVVCALLPF